MFDVEAWDCSLHGTDAKPSECVACECWTGRGPPEPYQWTDDEMAELTRSE